MEISTVVKRKRVKKIRTQPIEIHWTSFEVRNMPEGKQRELAQALYDYVRLPNKYTLRGYARENNISKAVWDDWCKRYPIIMQAHQNAREYLATKRFDAGASGNGREKLIMWAGQYDSEVFDYMVKVEQAKAKDADSKAGVNLTINMTKFDDEETVQIDPHMIPIQYEDEH